MEPPHCPYFPPLCWVYAERATAVIIGQVYPSRLRVLALGKLSNSGCWAHGGATTTGPDATHPPAICQNSGGGVGGGGGSWGGGSSRGSGGGGQAGGRGGGVGQGSGGSFFLLF